MHSNLALSAANVACFAGGIYASVDHSYIIHTPRYWLCIWLRNRIIVIQAFGAGIILSMGSSNGRRRYVTSSLIGLIHTKHDPCAGNILGMGSSNETRRNNVTSYLIGCAHTQYDPCNISYLSGFHNQSIDPYIMNSGYKMQSMLCITQPPHPLQSLMFEFDVVIWKYLFGVKC